MKLTKRFIEAYKGLAVGDAVGYQFEFDSDVNPQAVLDYADSTDVITISDDTQMTLFTLEAIKSVELYGHYEFKEVCDMYQTAFEKSYLNWYDTQNTKFAPIDRRRHGIVTNELLHHARHPGTTCISALSDLKDGHRQENDSMGCGSVMRILPAILLVNDLSLPGAIRIAQISGAVTHHHHQNDEAIALYMKAMHYLNTDERVKFSHITPVARDISELGSGWTALECVQMGIWAYANAHSYHHLLQLAIAHDGDSDSTAAIAGSLWGLAGHEVPMKYVDKLDVKFDIVLNM
jgi:ADP-ribosyl-[dinitrogen reductase] hydrolase